MTTGQRIKEARKRAGVTQVELGALLGVSGSMIAQYETDKRNPKQETIQRIADALNVSVSSLNGWDIAQGRLNSAGLSIDDVAHEMNIPVETLQKIIRNEDTDLSEAMPKVIQVAVLLASEMEKEALARKEREMKDYVARRSKGEAGPGAFDGAIRIHSSPEQQEYSELMKKYTDGTITDDELRRLGELQAQRPPLKETFGMLKTTFDRMKRCLDPLNEEGQQKVIEHAEAYAQDLAEIPRYRRQEPVETPPASPVDTDTPMEQDVPEGAEKGE